MRSSFVVGSLIAIILLVACAESGVDTPATTTTSTVMAFADEPAGANCAAGGTKIASGIDANGNGVLDEGEAKETRYVCNGGGETATDGGAAPARLVEVEDEPKGANCAAGGVRIDTGLDADGDGHLDASEVASTKYVCNGVTSDAGAGGVTKVVSEYAASSPYVQSQATSVTAHSASIFTPGPGKVYAILTSDLFCASPATNLGYDCASSGPTAGYNLLTTNVAASADATGNTYFFLTPNATETVTRQATFDVAAAGNLTVFVRAKMGGIGQYSMSRSTLTLLFVPS